MNICLEENEMDKKTRERIDFLNTGYKEIKTLSEFHILHLYPGKGTAYPNGYIDAKSFTLWAFNTNRMEKINLGEHDSLDFERDISVNMVRIFADGSTLIKFNQPVKVFFNFQAISIAPSRV